MLQSMKEADYEQIQAKLPILKRILAGENSYFIYNFTEPKICWQNFNSVPKIWQGFWSSKKVGCQQCKQQPSAQQPQP
jgi:hypothetical protein